LGIFPTAQNPLQKTIAKMSLSLTLRGGEGKFLKYLYVSLAKLPNRLKLANWLNMPGWLNDLVDQLGKLWKTTVFELLRPKNFCAALPLENPCGAVTGLAVASVFQSFFSCVLD
jgi:hypothetical protein